MSIGAGSDDEPAPFVGLNGPDAVLADSQDMAHQEQAKAGAQPFASGEILIGFEGEVAAAYRGQGAAAALEAAGKLVGAEGLHGAKVLMEVPAGPGRAARLATHWQLPAGADVPEMVNRLTGRPGIAYAEPNYALSIDATTPNDPQFDELWGMHNTGQTGGTADADIDAPEAWEIVTGSGSIVVGVIDSGIDYTHEDLYFNAWINQGEIPVTIEDTDSDGLITFYDLNDGANFYEGGPVSDLNGNSYIDAGDLLADPNWADSLDGDGNTYTDDIVGWDFYNDDNDPFDDNGHGTHVSGTIGAVGHNGVGVAGVNWNTQIMGIKAFSAGGTTTTDIAIEAVTYATMMRNRGVDIRLTNNSWGGGDYSNSMYDAIQASGDAGMLFVAAAGNNYADNDAGPYYPASYDLPNIISVAATNSNDAKPAFSNWGLTTVDLGAPGAGILSTTPGDTYSVYNGTSMATPHVSGAAALAWSLVPDATSTEIRQAIFDGVDKIAALDASQGSTTPAATGGRLSAFGTLGELAMVVTESSPASWSLYGPPDPAFPQPPTDFVIDFSFPYNPDEVHAEDLQVNGVPADDFSFTDGDTVTFHYTSGSPVTGEGPQTMSMAAGSLMAASSSGILAGPALQPWSATFDYTEMQIVLTDPADGATVPLPMTNLAVTFYEPYDPATADSSDLILSQGWVAGVNTDTGYPNTVEYILDGIESEGSLAVEMRAGALTDLDGNPNVAYSGSHFLDFDTIPLPAALQAEAPLGSLVYDGTVSGFISYSGDTDSFTIDLDAGQTITVVVHPPDPVLPLAPAVQLSGPGITVDPVSAEAGQDAVIQTAGPTEEGEYTITVSGAGDTSTGAYTLRVILNAAVEDESHGGAGNDDIASAQDIDALINSSFITLADGATRGAVMGGIEDTGYLGPDGYGYEASPEDSFFFEDISDTGQRLTKLDGTLDESVVLKKGGKSSGFQFNFYGTNYNEKQIYASSSGLIAFGSGAGGFNNGDFSSYPSQPAITPFYDTLIVESTSPDAGVYWQIMGSGDNQYLVVQWHNVRFSGSTGNNPITFQAILHENDGSPYIQFNYLDLEGGYSGDGGASATVAIKDAGPQGDNRLLVSYNAGPNQYVGTRLSTKIGVGIAPNIETPDEYTFDLGASQPATLVLKASGGNADVELQDADGYPVEVVAVPGTTNVDEAIQFAGGAEGTYYAVVTGATRVQYTLVVTRGADFDLEPNFGPDPWASGTFQDLGDGGVVLGAVLDGSPEVFVPSGSGGLNRSIGLDFSLDGQYLVVSSFNSDEVMRYDAVTGAPRGTSEQPDDAVFVTAQSGGLDAPEFLRFGPDGNLYVVSSPTHQVFRYNGQTGAFMDAFVDASDNGGLNHPIGLTFGPDGDLYVGGSSSSNVLRYDGTDGHFVGVFVSTGSGGLNRPEGLAFGPDGNLYVSSSNSNQVLRYDGQTGAFLGAFLPAGSERPSFPTGLLFSPDGRFLYVNSASDDRVLRYDGTTGAFIDVYIPPGAGGHRPTDLTWGAGGSLCVSTADLSTVVRVPGSSDFYRITVPDGTEGARLELTTATPGDGEGEFVNELNPMVRLYDDSGALLAGDDDSADDGRNASLVYPLVAAGGDRTYYVEVLASEGAGVSRTIGEYVLAVDVVPLPPPPGITVSKTSLTTTEAGGTDTFTLVLNTDPGEGVTVTIPLSSSNTAEGTIDVTEVTFIGGSGGDWSTPQTVTVTGVGDFVDDDDVVYAILTAKATAPGSPPYDNMEVADVTAINLDDDTAGIAVDLGDGVVTYEAGGPTTDTFLVRLNSEPTGDVSVYVTSSDTSQATVSPEPLIFTNGNWNAWQTVTVTGVNDSDDDGNVHFVVNLEASSDDAKYGALAVAVPAVNVDDDQSQGVLDDFEDGNLEEYSENGAGAGYKSNASITYDLDYVHDGEYALKDETNYGTLGWIYRTDAAAQVQRGDVISAWVLSESGTDWSRAYVGFGASRKGTLSLTMGVNTDELLIDRVTFKGGSGTYENLAAVSQSWLPDHWYRMEVQWGENGTIIGRLYDSDGVTVLNEVTAVDTKFTSGGIAFRAFGSTKYFDTVEIRMPPEEGQTAAVNSEAGSMSSGALADAALIDLLDYDLAAHSAAGVPLPAPAAKARLDPPADALYRLLASDRYALDLLYGPKTDNVPILASHAKPRGRSALDLALLDILDEPIDEDLLPEVGPVLV